MASEIPSETIPPPAPNASNITFTFEEQALSSASLYSMALFCIVVGAIRSANFVRRQISKKKLIEGSITVKEARKFPITASIVLFSLYIFFKPDGREWILGLITTYLPKNVSAYAQPFLSNATASASTSPSPSLVSRCLDKLPVPVHEGLTVVLSYLPALTKDNAMKALLFLLCFEGCCALANILKFLFTFILNLLPIGDRWPKKRNSYFVSIKKGNKEMEEGDLEDANKKDYEYWFKLHFDTHDVIAILVCLSVGISHIYKRHWITNNLLGIAFSIYGIENLHLSSFKAGAILLAGLFVYDIFWVFATDVMTSVAKGIDAPILLQFPQDILRHGWYDANKYSMLGLGDIVIPGIFIALLRRFDLRVTEVNNKKKEQGNRYFFVSVVIAYALGLCLTMFVMHHFKAAQPALLYLVPCCLLVPLLIAACTGEAGALWNYNEEAFIEKPDEQKKVDLKKKTN